VKILYIDPTCHRGHKGFNSAFLLELNKIDNANITLVCKANYIDPCIKKLNKIFYPEGIFSNDYEYGDNLLRMGKNILKSILTLQYIIKRIDSYYDAIILSDYHILSFIQINKLLKFGKIFLINHRIDSFVGYKISILKSLNKTINHIVFEEYIKNYLINVLGIKNNVIVFHHPLNHDIIDNSDKSLVKETMTILAPSSSNDEEIIKKIIKLFDIKEISIPDNIDIIIKSKNLEYKKDNLYIYNNFIGQEEYLINIKKSDYFLQMYSDSYKHRASGVFYEAVLLNKKLLSFPNLFVKSYLSAYPELGMVFEDIIALFKFINSVEIWEFIRGGSGNDRFINFYNNILDRDRIELTNYIKSK
jgi:hypothetical protein